jgi:hypothetical protein
MNDHEFDLLDDLYFVNSYENLKINLQWDHQKIRQTLLSLIEKDWIRIYKSGNEEIQFDDSDFEANHRLYFYLANKKGLLAHHGRL